MIRTCLGYDFSNEMHHIPLVITTQDLISIKFVVNLRKKIVV